MFFNVLLYDLNIIFKMIQNAHPVTPTFETMKNTSFVRGKAIYNQKLMKLRKNKAGI